MSSATSASGGHVFIVRGRVQDLASDAWAISCDVKAGPKKERWLPEWFRKEHSSYEWPKPPSGWWDYGVRVSRVTNWPETDTPQPWMLNVGGTKGTPIEWYEEGVRQFFEAASQFLKDRPPLHGRARHLIALPAVGTGRGGLAEQAGEVVLQMLPALHKEAVRGIKPDIAFCVPTYAAFAAAQAARSKLELTPTLSSERGWQVWPSELSKNLKEKAEALARHASGGKLALFIGAGTSKSAGLPLWSELLNRLRQVAEIQDSEWAEIDRLRVPLLDQAALVRNRLTANGKDLIAEVVKIIQERRHHSLTHGLLAGLPVREAVTTNYDKLFESAWTAYGPDWQPKKPFVLPYDTGPELDRWLLKLHGCVDHPEDIVLTREDFLRYAERRGALTGVVQTLLITRHLLVVGFALDDPNFHEIMDAVRRVLERRCPQAVRRVLERRCPQTGREEQLGTVLMPERKPPIQELWSRELDWVGTDFPPEAGRDLTKFDPQAGRLQDIFLDYLASRVRDASRLRHLLNSRYEGVLDEEERILAETLKGVALKLKGMGTSVPSWDQFREWLDGLGYSDDDNPR